MTRARTAPAWTNETNRLLATISTDIRLQVRNGFYAAVGFLLVVYVVLINLIPPFDWAYALPSLLLGNLAVATFFFIAGQVLLEKQEGTITAQIVTPLSFGILIGSKVLTLTLLSLVENGVLALLTVGLDIDFLALLAGLTLASAVYCLAGFAVVSRYDSINQFLLPAFPWVALANLPILDSLGLWSSPVLWLHPLQPAMTLLHGAVAGIDLVQWLYGLLASLMWICLLVVWCRTRFERHIVARVGVVPA